MKYILMLTLLLGLSACDTKKAGEHEHEIQTFADPAIEQLHKAQAVQATLDTSQTTHDKMMKAAEDADNKNDNIDKYLRIMNGVKLREAIQEG